MADEFFDPQSPTNKRILNVASWAERATTTPNDVVWVSGRADPVVITAVRRYPSGTLEVVTLDGDEAEWLRSLLGTGRIVGFRPDSASGLDNPTYLAVSRVTEKRIVRRVSAPERLWTLEVQVVRAPSGVL